MPRPATCNTSPGRSSSGPCCGRGRTRRDRDSRHRQRSPLSSRRWSRSSCLSDFLRHRLGLAGTHVGCEHGVCGACASASTASPFRACCMLAVQADGSRFRDRRIPRRRCTPLAAAGVLQAPPRTTVRLLHARDPDGGRRPALAGAAPSGGRRSSTCSPGTSAAAPATPPSSPRSRTPVDARGRHDEGAQ